MLVRWNVPGSLQLYLAAPGTDVPRQLTELDEPVDGRFVPGSGRLLLSVDAGGNERAQLYLADPEPGAPHEPLVVEPDFLHLTPRLSPDGTLLAYACNRRNGQDLDVFVRTLATGEERCVFAPGGYCEVTGFSPDGRLLGVLRLTERTGDNDLHLVDLSSGETVHVAPEEDDARFGAPAWARDSRSFAFSTDSGRDVAGIARYDLASDSWAYVLEDEWDLEVDADVEGRSFVVHANVDGASRLTLHDPTTLAELRELELPDVGRRRRDPPLRGRPLARVRVLLALAGPGRRSASTSRAAGPPRRSTETPVRVPPDELRGPVAASVRLVRRRVDPLPPLRARGRAAVAGRRRGARRPRVAAAADLDARDPVPRRARLRRRAAERARLDGLRQALRAPRRRTASPRLGAGHDDAARRARPRPAHRRRSGRALRRLLRRLHGARGARLRAGALGGGHRRRRDLPPRHLPPQHVRVPPRPPRARVRLARARPRLPDGGLAADARRPDGGAAPADPRRERPARPAERGRAAPPGAARPRNPVRAPRLPRTRGTGCRSSTTSSTPTRRRSPSSTPRCVADRRRSRHGRVPTPAVHSFG